MPGSLIWLLFSAALLFAFALGRKDARSGRYRRRGGYIKPPASPITRAGTTLTQSATGTTASISSLSVPGGVSEAWETPRLLRDRSRITGRGWSTVGTEALGANGARRRDAA